MEYTSEIIINKPIAKVIELFDNSDNMSKWQPELIDFQHVEGTPGEVGAKSKLKYKMGKREIEMIETITKKNLPKEFSGTYEAKGVFNEIVNEFISLDEGTTKWISYNKFEFSGFMKLMALIMPGAFKKQSLKYLQQFKEFAENS